MNAYFLAPPPPATEPPPPEPPLNQRRKLRLESLDGSRSIPLHGAGGWRAQSGSTGLEMPPVTVATNAIPGVPGSALQEVRVEERPVFLPILAQASTAISHRDMLTAIRDLLDPLRGEFRLVGTSAGRERQLAVIYTGGLEGADGRDVSGLYWRKLGVTAIACQPFAEARTDRLVEFRLSSGGAVFLGADGGTEVAWPRALSSTAVIGEGMEVRVASEVPVYPTLELVGPLDSFEGTLSPVVTDDTGTVTARPGSAWHVSVPNGVPAGSTMRLVTDPRARSIRMDGQLAAGRVARGSTLRPFYPGMNVLDVSAPGGTEATRIRLSWRELYRSLW